MPQKFHLGATETTGHTVWFGFFGCLGFVSFFFFLITCKIKCAEVCVLVLVWIFKTNKENQFKLNWLEKKKNQPGTSSQQKLRDSLVLYPKYFEGQDRYKGENGE